MLFNLENTDLSHIKSITFATKKENYDDRAFF